jgi:hypothetical protein
LGYTGAGLTVTTVKVRGRGEERRDRGCLGGYEKGGMTFMSVCCTQWMP